VAGALESSLAGDGDQKASDTDADSRQASVERDRDELYDGAPESPSAVRVIVDDADDGVAPRPPASSGVDGRRFGTQRLFRDAVRCLSGDEDSATYTAAASAVSAADTG